MDHVEDVDALLAEAEAWARPRVTFHARHDRGGHQALVRFARLDAGAVTFEREMSGPIGTRDGVHERVRDEVVREFVGWAEAIIRSGGWPAYAPFAD
jgi:hypothetical protein